MNEDDLKSIRNKERSEHICVVIGTLLWLFVFISVGHSCSAKADIYIKIGAGYTIDQPSQFKYSYTDNTKASLNTNYSDYSLHFEQGIRLDNITAGVYGSWSEGEIHNPSKVEIFADYDWLNSKWHFKTGLGYKIHYQNYVNLNNKKHYYTDDSFQDKLSARFGLSRDFNNIEIGVWHHSQWFRGAPFSSGWEYHKTELFIDYKWTL